MNREDLFAQTQEREVDLRSRSAARAVSLAALVIYPAWSVFDYLIAPDLWVRFTVMRVLEAGLIVAVYAAWRAGGVRTETLVYVAFLGMALQIAYMCATVQTDALLPYFLGFSTLFVAAGILILWPPIHSVVVLLAALVALMIFNELFYSRPLTVMVEHGAFLFVTLATVSVILTQMRYRMVRDEVTARLRVEAAHHELERQAAELAMSNRELARFARLVSHDLKTPMNRLSLAVDILEDPSLGAGERGAALHAIRDALGFASRTVDELLGATRVAKPGARSAPEAVDLAAVYAELEPEIHEELSDAGGRVITDFEACPSVVIERGKLKSILQNLLTNAVKFRSPGRPPEIRITSAWRDSFAVLSVSDNGLGMQLERNDGAAVPLPRNRQHPDIRGSGLGLSLVKDMVESEGGRIEVESQLGHGSTLRVWLPDRRRSERKADQL